MRSGKKHNDNNPEEVTFVDKLEAVGTAFVPLWIVLFFLCCVGINECQDRHAVKDTAPPYRTEDVYTYHPIEPGPSASQSTKRSISPVQNKGGDMLDRLESEDYYDLYDYYDGLDGEYGDIDYNDLTDYYAD